MNIKMTESPKLFYTPDEVDEVVDMDFIHLSFSNSAIVPSMFLNNNYELDSRIKITKILYIKIFFRNAKYDYVWVMEKAKDLFMEVYAYNESRQ